MIQLKSFTLLFCALTLTPSALHAARVVLRIDARDPVRIYEQYADYPDSYPTTQKYISHLTFSGPVVDGLRDDGTRLFDTPVASHETGKGETEGVSGDARFKFSGDEVVGSLRAYENNGWIVDHVLVFREDYLKRGGPGGPYEEDVRILGPDELANIRNAIANSNLECKDTVKIIQLIGSRVNGHRGDTWFDCIENPELMEHLMNFDGIGTECHVGDHTTNLEPDGPNTLRAMAAITKWAQDNGKLAHVFMGGNFISYKQPANARATYNFLWDEMDALGVDKKSEHLIYFRQGARSLNQIRDPGDPLERDHTPESGNTLTAQMKELIENVWTPAPWQIDQPDSGLVAHWPMDEGTGATTADASGYGTDAVLLNGASWGSDATRGSYVWFDGTDDRISTAFRYALSDTDDFTWAWWGKKEAASHSNSIMVGNRFGGTGSESFEFIKFMPNKASFADTGSATNIEDYNYSDLPSGQWHHYAMVKNGTSYQWYVDGVAEGSPVTINYNETAPLPFLIGGDGENKPNEHFEGSIDDVVLYRSALTPVDVSNVMNGIYHPTVTMVDLGSPVDLTDASTWSDAQPAHANANYVIPATGNLRGQTGTSTFPGTSLKVEAGGRFQVRSLDSDGQTMTVDDLILAGGVGFGSGQFAELAAGTGSNETNVLEGAITQSGATRLTTYGGSINRRLIVNSQISGSGTLQATGAGVTITNAGNTFSGIWETSTSLVFTHSGAVGSADVEVTSGGALDIQGDWLVDAVLTVADTASTQVAIGPNEWKVSSLTLGATPIADGIYSSAELSALGSASFSGTGRVTVGNPPMVQEVIAGWDVWNSSTSPAANVTAAGITATASASSSGSNWSTTDNGSSGRGSSGNTTWGTFDGNTTPASAVTTGSGANMTALNGVTTAQITFTITNNGATDWDLDAFHMDALGFRPGAPRTYQLEVLSGDITNGVVFISTEDAITDVGGTLSGNNQHDDIDLSLIGLADSRLEPGESAVIQIAFSSGAGSANGHHLFVDNVAISGITTALTQQQSWRFEYFDTIENVGTAADSYDANFDGESNFMEFATHQDPHESTLVSTPVGMEGDLMAFRYTRSKGALQDGVTFQVEWSDSLASGDWSSVGVVDQADPDNPGDEEVEHRRVMVPVGSAGQRFVHLRIEAP